MSNKSLEATAYHEAGHVAANLLLGIKVKTATIKPGDGYLGRVEDATTAAALKSINRVMDAVQNGDRAARRRARERAENALMTLLAGNVAQRFFSKKRIAKGAMSDWQKALEYCEALSDGLEESSAYFAYMMARTRSLILRPMTWLQVEAIASALLERETMTRAEVESVWEETGRFILSPGADQRLRKLQRELGNYFRDHPLRHSEWKWAIGQTGDQGGEE